MKRTRIKFCGITRSADLAAAVSSGADALGLVFYPASPRAVTSTEAAELLKKKPAWVSIVGLFVNAEADWVRDTVGRVALDCLQFHGEESPEYCQQFGLPWMKAIAVAPDDDVMARAAPYTDATAILLDTHKEGVPGGTGECFDWSLIPQTLGTPIVLAGGLTPENVGTAVRSVRPYAVDVSGGVELTPGHKSAEHMQRFTDAVRAADMEVGV